MMLQSAFNMLGMFVVVVHGIELVACTLYNYVHRTKRFLHYICIYDERFKCR